MTTHSEHEMADGFVVRPAWRNQWLSLALFPVVVAWAVWITAWGLFPDLIARLPPPQELFLAAANTNVSALLVGTWGAVIALGGRLAYLRYVDQYRLDEQRVAQRHGIVARTHQSIQLSGIQSVEMRQSLMQRLLGVGDILVYSSGSDEAEVTFRGIRGPVFVQTAIQWMQTKAVNRD